MNANTEKSRVRELHQELAGIAVLRQALAVFLLASFLTIHAFSAAPVLHHAVHSNASHADHHCVLTSFAQGQIHFTAPEATLKALHVCPELSFPGVAQPVPSRGGKLLSARDPPALA